MLFSNNNQPEIVANRSIVFHLDQKNILMMNSTKSEACNISVINNTSQSRAPRFSSPFKTLVAVPEVMKEEYCKEETKRKLSIRNQHINDNSIYSNIIPSSTNNSVNSFSSTSSNNRRSSSAPKRMDNIVRNDSYVNIMSARRRDPSPAPPLRALHVIYHSQKTKNNETTKTNNKIQPTVPITTTNNVVTEKKEEKILPKQNIEQKVTKKKDKNIIKPAITKEKPPSDNLSTVSTVTVPNSTISKATMSTNMTLLSDKSSKSLHGFAIMDNTNKLCTPEMEQICRQWLHDLNFDSILTRDKTNLLQDPLRNGIFLCELVETLEGTKIPINRQPKKLSDAKENIEKTLATLKRKNIPSVYLYNTERILKGEQELIWGLIYHIMTAYPEATTNKNQHYSKKEFVLYSSELTRELEQSLLFWFRSLGLLPLNKPLPKTISDLEEEIRNGTLLCDLVGLITGETIVGVTRIPKIASASLSNINKALEPLRLKKRMCQKFLWSEQEILNGNKSVILGLFEDIRRYYDGIAPRTSKTNKPYLGNYSSSTTIGVPLYHLSIPPKSTQNIDKIHSLDKVNNEKNSGSLIRQMMNSNFKDDNGNYPIPTTPPTELKATVPIPSKYSSIDNRLYPEPFFPSTHLTTVFLPQPYEIDKSLNAMGGSVNPEIEIEDIAPNNNITGRYKTKEKASKDKIKTTTNSALVNEKSLERNRNIVNWIEKDLGIQINLDTFDDEMKNGVKLSDIVARCEGKHELRGIERKPKKTAQMTNNINRALAVLRDKKDMNPTYLWSTEEILNCDSNVIWSLLSDIYKCYCKKKQL